MTFKEVNKIMKERNKAFKQPAYVLELIDKVYYDSSRGKWVVEQGKKFKGAFSKQADAEKRLQSLRNSVEK